MWGFTSAGSRPQDAQGKVEQAAIGDTGSASGANTTTNAAQATEVVAWARLIHPAERPDHRLGQRRRTRPDNAAGLDPLTGEPWPVNPSLFRSGQYDDQAGSDGNEPEDEPAGEVAERSHGAGHDSCSW